MVARVVWDYHVRPEGNMEQLYYSPSIATIGFTGTVVKAAFYLYLSSVAVKASKRVKYLPPR